ncbi:MAG: hypothetical protein ACR2HQ_13675 [Ilumatobacteraceae bacterium]
MAGSPARPRTVDEVDLFDPATQEDWYPTYDLLRQEAPVWRLPGTNTYVLTRPVSAPDRSERTWSGRPCPTQRAERAAR